MTEVEKKLNAFLGLPIIYQIKNPKSFPVYGILLRASGTRGNFGYYDIELSGGNRVSFHYSDVEIENNTVINVS